MTTDSHGPRRSGRRRAAPRRAAGRGRALGRPRAASRRTRSPEATSAETSTTRLTAAGAFLTVLGCTLTGALLDGLFGAGFGVATWAGFVAGCVTATVKVRPRHLLALVITTPMLFLVALLIGQTIRVWGSSSWLRTELIGLATALSEGAPWLFAGTAAVVLIAWARGLRGNLQQLRAELRGAPDDDDGEPGDEPRRASNGR